ncbi:MAG: hypothetical protein AAB860_00880 [Patescibacteria group bacterium]
MIKKFQYWILALLIIGGFLVRLYKINNPIADWHSWRQSDTSAVTRNFVKYGIDVLHPRYDDMSDVSGRGLFNPKGFRFVEFPIFNLVHYFLYSLSSGFYTLEFWGRMTAILSALTSSVLIFFIVRRHSSIEVGLFSAFFYLFLPYNIYFTRVVLPEPLMVTLFLAALLAFDTRRRLLTFIFGSLALLVKPMAIFFLLPIIFKDFWLFIFMLVPFGLWRVWEMRYPEGMPASWWLLNGNGIRFRPAWFRWLFGERLGDMILGQWGIFPFLLGLFQANSYFLIWAAGALLYLVVFATGNVHHDYYQIPLIPIISVLIALGVVHFGTTLAKKAIMVFCVLLMFGLAWYDIKGDYQINNWPIVEAGRAVDRLAPKDAVVIAPYGGDTAFLYQTNRAGFPFMYLPIKDFIDRFNATYYVSVNYDADTNAIIKKYTVVEKTPNYVIVKLEEPIRP